MNAHALRVAVVGHVEWVRFARVSHIPHAGEIVHARDPFEEPAGGGAVAAVQLARLAGASLSARTTTAAARWRVLASSAWMCWPPPVRSPPGVR
jgi:hypothetical protein